MKVKLKIGKVINGAVWLAETVVGDDVGDAVEMQRWVDEGEAEIVGLDTSGKYVRSTRPAVAEKDREE